jgi:tetratricopeptide (TPR) repeat protein
MKRGYATCVLLIVLFAVAAAVSDGRAGPRTNGVEALAEGLRLARMGELLSALAKLDQADRAFTDARSSSGRFLTGLSRAGIHRLLGNYDTAEQQIRQCRDTASELSGHSRWVSLSLLEKADLEISRMRYTQAATILNQALEASDSAEDRIVKGLIRIRIARLHVISGELGKAARTLNLAESALAGQRLPTDRARLLMVRGRLNRDANRFSQSLKCLDDALALARETDARVLEHRILVEKTLTLAQQGARKQAEALLSQSIASFARNRIQPQLALANIALAWTRCRSQSYARAQEALHEAKATLNALKLTPAQADIHLVEAGLCAAAGDLPKAARLLQRSREMFGDQGRRMGAIRASLALAAVHAAQGLPNGALEAAGSAKTMADAMGNVAARGEALEIKARVLQAREEYGHAYRLFQDAERLNRTPGGTSARWACMLGMAECLVATGYGDPAARLKTAMQNAPELTSNAEFGARLAILSARLAARKGHETEALSLLTDAGKRFAKRLPPGVRAELATVQASLLATQRQIVQAADRWKQAEQTYGQLGSPGHEIRCREHRVRLALDQGDVQAARDLVDDVHVCAAAPSEDALSSSPGRPSAHAGAQPASQSAHDQKRPACRWLSEADRLLLHARVEGLNAQVLLAEDRAREAEEALIEALPAVKAYGGSMLLSEFSHLHATIARELGRYDRAPAALEAAPSPDPWRVTHLKALALNQSGDRNAALEMFNHAITELQAQERRHGLWHVAPRALKQREQLYLDAVDALMERSRETGSTAPAARAWRLAQQTIVRRTARLFAVAGAESFPGVPAGVIAKHKEMSYASRARDLRLRFPLTVDLDGIVGDAAPTRESSPVPETVETSRDLLAAYPEYRALVHSEAPSISRLQAVLGEGEHYVAFLATRQSVHAFLIGPAVFRAVICTENSRALRDRISMLVNEPGSTSSAGPRGLKRYLWSKLFGAFSGELAQATALVIQPDASLITFPFERLEPDFVDSASPGGSPGPLVSRIPCVRSTSTLCFVLTRERGSLATQTPPRLFLKPVLPVTLSVDVSTHKVSSVSKVWRDAVKAFRTSGFANRPTTPNSSIVRAFGPDVPVFRGPEATWTAWSTHRDGTPAASYLACPLLIPETVAGRVSQPFIVFSPPADRPDPDSGFCGLSEILSGPHSEQLVILPWMSAPASPGAGEGLFCLIEALGYMGAHGVAVPLRASSGTVDARANRFIELLIGRLRTGTEVAAAVHQTWQEILAEEADEQEPLVIPLGVFAHGGGDRLR